MSSAGNAMLKCFFSPLLFKKIQSTQVWTCLQIERSNTATSMKSTVCMQQGIHTYLYVKVWLNRNPHRKCGKWFTKCLTEAVCLENRDFFRNQGLHLFEGSFSSPKSLFNGPGSFWRLQHCGDEEFSAVERLQCLFHSLASCPGCISSIVKLLTVLIKTASVLLYGQWHERIWHVDRPNNVSLV